MAVITAPSAPGLIARSVSGVRRMTATARGGFRRVLTPHKAALRNLADIPLTVAGAACMDFAGFHLAHGWGWLVTGVSLVVLEHLIADEQ